MWLLFIDDHDAPLRFFRSLFDYLFCVADCFEHCLTFLCEFTKKLCGHLSIRFAGKFDVAEVIFFNNRVTTNDPIMDYVDWSSLIKMRMSISLNFLSTCCPSCMANSDVGFDDFLANFFHEPIYAVYGLVGLLCVLDHFFLDSPILLAECDYACTVIASIL